MRWRRAGYAGTSVAHVTTRAGVSRKSFYEQFTDKQDCYFAAYDMAMEIQGASVVRATRHLDAKASPIEYFRAVVRAFLEGIAAHPAAARTLLIELYAVGPEASRRKSGRGRMAMGALMAPLGLTDESGRLSFHGRIIVGAIASLAQQLVAEDRTSEAPDLCDPFVDWVARHLDCLPGGEQSDAD